MENQLDRSLAALADPTRRMILKLLLERDMTVTEIAAQFDMTLAGVSKHLRTLAKAGLISRRREGRTNWCRIELDGLGPAHSWLQEFGYLDQRVLETLEILIDRSSGSASDRSDLFLPQED